LRSSFGNLAKFSLRDRERQRENQSLDPRIVSNVGKTPAQCHRDDEKYGDHTEISEPLSNGRMLPHLGNRKIASK
jgi:hypothetical protein